MYTLQPENNPYLLTHFSVYIAIVCFSDFFLPNWIFLLSFTNIGKSVISYINLCLTLYIYHRKEILLAATLT